MLHCDTDHAVLHGIPCRSAPSYASLISGTTSASLLLSGRISCRYICSTHTYEQHATYKPRQAANNTTQCLTRHAIRTAAYTREQAKHKPPKLTNKQTTNQTSKQTGKQATKRIRNQPTNQPTNQPNRHATLAHTRRRTASPFSSPRLARETRRIALGPWHHKRADASCRRGAKGITSRRA